MNETELQEDLRGNSIAILINRDYRPDMDDLELFEITRGIWTKKMVTASEDRKYAFAFHKKVVKDVYEISHWVPAGTHQYFTRGLCRKRLETNRWEFIGKKAPDEIRLKYIDKKVTRDRSYGDPFVKM